MSIFLTVFLGETIAFFVLQFEQDHLSDKAFDIFLKLVSLSPAHLRCKNPLHITQFISPPRNISSLQIKHSILYRKY